MKKILISVLLLFSTILHAGGAENVFEAGKYYTQLSERYEKNLSKGKYNEAYEAAIKQLTLDPSDTAAYLRMAIAAQHLNVDGQIIIDQYSPEISERDVFHKMIKSTASALLKGPKCKPINEASHKLTP